MSENLTALSFRKGIEHNLFERMQQASSDPVALRKMSEDCLMGEAVTLGAVSFYDFLKKENREKKVFLCNGSACLCAGTQGPLKRRLAKHFSESEIGEICCLGRCYENGAFQYQGSNYSALEEESIESLFTSEKKAQSKDYHVGSNMEMPLLVAEFPGIDTFYSPFKELVQRDRQSVCEDLKNSGLRGRGGAGFPMGIKVEACRQAQGSPKYVVCNADEGDPGAYIDKFLMEQRPHSVLFGMITAGWLVGAEVGVLYIRAEYPDSILSIEAAIHELQDQGYLGDNILDSGFSFRLKVIKGAGSYICGEETALLASIEGQRPEVRVRPPFPVEYGLFGRPTLVNNVETFANVQPIFSLGVKNYSEIGTEQSKGTKLLSLDGHFHRPGLYEVAMGTPLRIVIDELGGGFRVPVKAVQVGGPLGGLIPVDKIDEVTVSFESFQQAGFLLGHAGVVSIPEDFPMIEYIEHLFQFTAVESCGKCFPCRLGSVRGQELMHKARGGDYKIDRGLIDDLLETMEQTSLCALGGGVPLPIKNALNYFQDELAVYFKAKETKS